MSTTYKKYTTSDGKPIQVDSAIRDGSGKNIANNYAKQNGYYQTLKSGESDLADNIKTNEGSSVVDAVAQFDPISQAVEDGSYAKMDNMKGRSFAYNQLFDSQVGESWSHYFDMNYNRTWIYRLPIVAGKKCLVSFKLSDIVDFVETDNFCITMGADSTVISHPIRAGVATYLVTVPTTGDTNYIFIRQGSTSTGHLVFSQYAVFDLTAMGLGSVTTVDEALAALRSYGIEPTVYNEYSEGKIIDSQPNKIISRGINQWGEDWESGIYSFSDGKKAANPNYIRNKTPIEVLPNTKYYWKNSGGDRMVLFYDANGSYLGYLAGTASTSFTSLKTSKYINFYILGTTYNHDITIALGSTNPGYHAYVSSEHDLVLPVMRSAGSVADDKEFVRVGRVDLGTLDWNYRTEAGGQTFSYPYFQASLNVAQSKNLMCVMYTSNGSGPMGAVAFGGYSTDKEMCVINNAWMGIAIRNLSYTDAAAFKAAMSGVYLNYELATPVAQDPAISLPQNIKVWNEGSLETQYETPNTTPGLISLTYQANIKNFVEGVGKRNDINWAPNNVVSQAQLQAGLEPKADIERIEDGEIKAGIAKSLDTEVGKVDETPFSYTTVGIETDVETGFQELRKLVCADVVKNQGVYRVENTITVYGVTFTKLTNTTGKFSGTSTQRISLNVVYGSSSANSKIPTPYGHRFMYWGVEQNTQGLGIILNGYNGNTWKQTIGGASNGAPRVITNSNSEVSVCTMELTLESGVTLSKEYTVEPKIIDLTKRYGSNDVVDAIAGSGTPEEKAARIIAFDPEILSDTDYDAGTLVPSKTAKLKTVDYNQWDEEYRISDGWLWSKNKIKCLPNIDYCFIAPSNGVFKFYDDNNNVIEENVTIVVVNGRRVFHTPTNARFMSFRMTSVYGTTYKNDICISLYWDGSRIGYEPYQEHIYDMPNYEGHGILKVVDGKVVADGTELYPDGNSKKRYAIVDLGTLNWGKWGTSVFGTDNVASLIKIPASASVAPNAISNKLRVGNYYNTITDRSAGYGIAVSSTGQLAVYSETDYTDGNAFKSAMSGVYLIYELATEEDIETAPFNGNPYMDDFGTMEFLDENGNTILGLQGCEIFYKANVAGFAESLYVKTDGDPDDLVTQEELEPRDAVDTQLKEALGGTLRQLLAATQSVDFANTAWADLGDCDWTKYTTQDGVDRFITSYFDNLAGQNAKSVCTALKTHTGVIVYENNGLTMGAGGSRVSVTFTANTYADGAAVKAAMKGVLLAYEKASS